jgi:two-component system chemotaxis sensor kinase CheA
MYLQEAEELLTNVERQVVELESTPGDSELLDNIFRNLHTLKGSGSMFGYENVAAFTHDIETLFDLLRDQEMKATKEIIDLTLSARDHLWRMLFSPEEASAEEQERLQETFQSLTGRTNNSSDTPEGSEDEIPAAKPASGYASETTQDDRNAEKAGQNRTFRIRFKPEQSIFCRGTKLLPLIRELSGLGTCIAMAHTDNMPSLQDIDPEKCYVTWTFLLTTAEDENAVLDVFIFVEDDAELRVELIDEEDRLDVEADYKEIGKILYERGTLREEDIQQIMSYHERFGEIAVKKGLLDSSEVNSALEEQEYVRRRRQRRKESSSISTIKVKSKKLDTLIDLVGELVTLQAGLAQYSKDHSNGNSYGQSDIETISEELERLTSGLRDTTMNLRMVPLTETFNSFTRLVRDLCNDLDKCADLSVYGGDIELDKHIIDELKDPLIHIIRNSLDHGIEGQEERRSMGKPQRATITVGAEYEGAHVIIRISDDGRGLNPEEIRRKALARELITEKEELTEQEILDLIFLPGFSTAEEATSVSGRGVGMDVVKKNIEKLRGSIAVDTEIGKGTCMTLTIPLTLSIIDGLLFTVGSEYYIVNLSAVEECFDLTDEVRCGSETREYINIRENPISCIDLTLLFETESSVQGIRQGIIVNGEKEKVALLVDTILGQHQTVIKPLNSTLKELREISGSTILGDGSIAFILDVTALLRAEKEVTA